MKKSRFTKEQIAYALRQEESGTAVADVCRPLGVSEATFHVWKKKFAHLGTSERRRLRQLENENNRLMSLVADLTLDKHMLAEALRKTGDADPSTRDRPVVPGHLWNQLRARVSIGRLQPCRMVPEKQSAGSVGHAAALREFAQARPRFGYYRVYVPLRREGWQVNLKRVRRLYRLEGLRVRLRVRRRRHRSLHRGPVAPPAGAQQRWSMDFVHDQLADGRVFRVLTVVDQWSRQSPLLEVVQRVTGDDVAAALDRVRHAGTATRSITVDHGTEFISMALDP